MAKDLFELAEEKNVNIEPYLLAGYPPELLRKALETYIPPKGAIREFFHGVSRGALGLGAGALGIAEALTERIPGLRIIAEKILKPIREDIQKRGLRKVAPSPYEGLVGKVTGTLGSLLPYVGVAVTEPMALPAVTTLTETGAIYTEQPKEKKSLLRATVAGIPVGLLQALPVTRGASKALRAVAPIGKVMEKYPLASSMAVEATAFPTIFSAMRPFYEYGTGVALPERTAKDILAEAIVGGLFGVPEGISVRKTVGKKIEKELPPEKPKAEFKVEAVKPEKEPIIEPEKKEPVEEIAKPEVKPEERVEETKPEEKSEITLPYLISVLRKVYFTKNGKLKSAFSKKVIPDVLREDIETLVSFLKEPSFEKLPIDEKLEHIKFAYDFLRGLLKRKQVEPIKGEIENALKEVDTIADGVLMDYLYDKATERYGDVGTELVNMNLPLIKKVKEHRDLKEGAESFLDFIKQDIDQFLEPSEIPLLFSKEWFPEWKPNVKYVSNYLKSLLKENLPEKDVDNVLSVLDVDRYAQRIVDRMEKGEYVSWTEIITDFERDVYNLLRKLEEVPPMPERPVAPKIETTLTEISAPSERLVSPKRHVAEYDITTLFKLHPNVKETVDSYIRGSLGSRITDILKMKAQLPSQVRVELTKAFNQITSGEKGYLEAIFGRRIGSRLESALSRKKKEGKYTEEDLKFLEELKRNPIDTLLREDAEAKLYELAYKALSLEDILSIIVYGDIDTRTAIQETGIKAYKRASDYIKKDVFPAVESWVNKGEDKQYVLDELSRVKPNNVIEDHLLSVFQNYIEQIPNEEFGLSALKRVKENVTKYANTLIKNLRDIKKEERIETKETRKAQYIELLGNQLHATLRILKDLPFIVKKEEGIIPPNEEVYKRIHDINESYASAFAQKLGVSEIINNFTDWYASFVATARGHNLETKEGQQAFTDIKKNVDDMLQSLVTQENAYSIVPDVLFFPRDLESLNTDRPNGYVVLSFGETGEAKLLKLKNFLSDTFKEDIPFRQFFTDRLDLVVPEKRKFVIVDAENFRNFLEGKEDLEILDVPVKKLWDTYIRAIIKITNKKKFPKLLDLSDEPLNTFAENFDRNIIKTKEELSQYRDISYFLRNPAEYVKARLLEMIEASDVNRQIDEAFSKLIEDLKDKDVYYRTIEMAKRDPIVLSEPVKMFQFMKSVVAKALGEEVGIIVGNEYSPVVSYMRKALGVPFSGFALRLGDRRYIGIVFGEKSNGLITFGHELYHLIEPLLPETDRKLLYSKFKNTEEIAEAFGNYIFNKYQPPSFLKRLFDKMISIIDRIRNVFKGMGFVSAYDVFDKIYAGRLAREYKSPEEIPLAYFTDVWDIAKRIRDDFNNDEFEIAFRVKLEEARNRFVEFFKENSPYKLREWLYRISGGKVEAVSKEEREFRKRYFTKDKNPIFQNFYNIAVYPKYHDTLTVFHNYYSESVGKVNEITMRPLQEFIGSLESLRKENPELHDIAQKLIWYYNAEGRYPLEFEKEVKEMYPDLSANDISALKDIIDKAKNYYDIEAILSSSAIFDIGWNKLRGTLNTFEKANYIDRDTKNKLLTMLAHIRTEAHDKLFRLYDYRIEKVLDETTGREKFRRVAVNDKRHEPERLWYQYRDEILKMFGGDPEKYKESKDLSDLSKEHQEVFRAIENFMTTNLVRATYVLKGLDEGFYTPLVRQNGDYEVRLFVKFTDKKGKQKYVEIGYWDTDRRKSDFAQKNELLKIYRAVKEGLEKEKEVMEFRTEDWHKSEKSLTDFITEETIMKGKTPDYIIMVGKKPPKAERTIDKMSPYEAFDFIRSLALRTDDPEAQKLLKDVFPQALYSMYADVAYALARKLHRRLLPEQFSQRVIEGYRKDVLDVTKEYHIRMTGSLVNKFFLNRVLEAYESPQLKDLFIEDPELKSLIDKYVEATTAPHVPLASFVYKVRALTAMFYLGFRVSSAFINLTNLLTTFLPEFCQVITMSSTARTSAELINQLTRFLPKLETTGKMEYNIRPTKYLASVPTSLKKIFYDTLGDLKIYLNKGWIKRDLSGVDIEKAIRDGASDIDVNTLKVIQDLINHGKIESSFYQVLREEGMNLFGKTMHYIFGSSMFMFKYAESLGRLVATIATSKHLLQKDVNVNVVSEVTRHIVERTFMDYSRANRPYWANPGTPFGAIMSLPITLKGFIANLFGLYVDWVGRKEFEKLALSFLAFGVLGGMKAMPFFDDIVDIFERLTGKPLRLQVYNTLNKLGGESVADLITRGVPYALRLADLSSSLKVEAPLPKSTSFDALADIFLGVYKGVYERGLRGLEELSEGETIAGLSYLLPMGLSMFFQAGLLSTEGLRTRYGKPIIEAETGEPYKLTGLGIVLRSLGFRPVSLAKIQDDRYFGMRIEKVFKEWRKKLYEKYRRAETDEDLREVLEDIEEFNRKVLEYHGLIPPIRGRGLRRATEPVIERYRELTKIPALF